jgi:curved DNA-binding protein CbpA
MTRNTDPNVFKQSKGRNYYAVLGVPVGASINHVKDSYRLLSKKSPITDAAYEILTDPRKRKEYNAQLAQEFQPTTYTQVRDIEGYQRIDSDSVATNRSGALASLKGHGFRDCTTQVENTPSWSAFVEANGSGTERYFFSDDNQYLLMIDFSPFLPSGEGWHTLGWWLYKNNGEEWEPIRDGELGDYSLPLTLHEIVKHP